MKRTRHTTIQLNNLDLISIIEAGVKEMIPEAQRENIRIRLYSNGSSFSATVVAEEEVPL